MHAIYRQNFGFTNIVIGRKHADAPTTTAPPSGRLRRAGDLREARRRPPHPAVKVGFAAFYESIGRAT